MTIQETLESCPNAAKIIKEWYIKKLSEGSVDTPQEFLEAIKHRIDGMILSVAENNPSNLFNLFDENDIFIFTVMSDNNLFGYKIFTGATPNSLSPLVHLSEDNFANRKEAEHAAIIKAINLLEEKKQK